MCAACGIPTHILELDAVAVTEQPASTAPPPVA
jgi:hypothetical protein